MTVLDYCNNLEWNWNKTPTKLKDLHVNQLKSIKRKVSSFLANTNTVTKNTTTSQTKKPTTNKIIVESTFSPIDLFIDLVSWYNLKGLH